MKVVFSTAYGAVVYFGTGVDGPHPQQTIPIMRALSLLTAALLLSVTAAQAQKVNDAVEIESTGSWYPGKILQVDGDKFFVAYDGWSDTFNEWVGKDRLRGLKAEAAPEAPAALTKFKVGDRVEVEYGMSPAPATIVYVGENKYEVEFDYKPWGKKFYTEKEIKKL